MRLSRLGLVVLVVATLVGCKSKPAPERAQDFVQQGLAAHVAGRIDTALGDYQKALKLDPNNTYALYNVGLIAQNRGDTAEAERNYRLVIHYDPRFTSALFNLAIIRDAAGAPKEAIGLYQRVIAVTPKNANAHLNLGFALKEVGRKVEGNSELAVAVRLDPNLASRVPKSSSGSPTKATGPTASPSPSH